MARRVGLVKLARAYLLRTNSMLVLLGCQVMVGRFGAKAQTTDIQASAAPERQPVSQATIRATIGAKLMGKSLSLDTTHGDQAYSYDINFFSNVTQTSLEDPNPSFTCGSSWSWASELEGTFTGGEYCADNVKADRLTRVTFVCGEDPPRISSMAEPRACEYEAKVELDCEEAAAYAVLRHDVEGKVFGEIFPDEGSARARLSTYKDDDRGAALYTSVGVELEYFGDHTVDRREDFQAWMVANDFLEDDNVLHVHSFKATIRAKLTGRSLSFNTTDSDPKYSYVVNFFSNVTQSPSKKSNPSVTCGSLWSWTSELEGVFTGGEYCADDVKADRLARVTFVCGEDPPRISSVAEPRPCEYEAKVELECASTANTTENSSESTDSATMTTSSAQMVTVVFLLAGLLTCSE